MRWTLAIDISIPVAERLAMMVDEVDEGFRHLGVDGSWVGAERIRIVAASGVLSSAGDEERVSMVAGRVAASSPSFDVSVLPPRFAPSREEPRFVVAPLGTGSTQVRELRERLRGELTSLVDPWAVAEEGGAWILLGRLASTDRVDVTGFLPEVEGVLGNCRAQELTLLRWEATRSGVKPRVVRKFLLGVDATMSRSCR
jgi:2'-5' RNA ligase